MIKALVAINLGRINKIQFAKAFDISLTIDNLYNRYQMRQSESCVVSDILLFDSKILNAQMKSASI